MGLPVLFDNLLLVHSTWKLNNEKAMLQLESPFNGSLIGQLSCPNCMSRSWMSFHGAERSTEAMVI